MSVGDHLSMKEDISDMDKAAPPKISLPVQPGSLGSRVALELIRNSRLRSSCPTVPAASNSTVESSRKPLSVASFLAMKNCHRSPRENHTSGTPRHKKAVIPITSRQTSRVLNNLSMDCVAADVQIDECHSLPCSKSTSFEEKHSGDKNLVPLSDNDTLSTDSWNSDANSVETGQSNVPVSCVNWQNIRNTSIGASNRYSASSFGSTASEEDIWIPQTKI